MPDLVAITRLLMQRECSISASRSPCRIWWGILLISSICLSVTFCVVSSRLAEVCHCAAAEIRWKGVT